MAGLRAFHRESVELRAAFGVISPREPEPLSGSRHAEESGSRATAALCDWPGNKERRRCTEHVRILTLVESPVFETLHEHIYYHR